MKSAPLFYNHQIKPRLKRAAMPSFMAQVRNGLIKPVSGVDWLLFGISK